MVRGHYSKGEPDGLWQGWHRDGKKRFVGAYDEGQEDGEWVHYHPSGKTASSGTYQSGQRAGAWTWWYPDGSKRGEGNYTAGKASGPWQEFHRGGSTLGRGQFIEGRRAGAWQWWRKDGQKWRDATYRNGQEIETLGPSFPTSAWGLLLALCLSLVALAHPRRTLRNRCDCAATELCRAGTCEAPIVCEVDEICRRRHLCCGRCTRSMHSEQPCPDQRPCLGGWCRHTGGRCFRMPTALMDIASSTPASARAEPSKTPESAATRVQTWAVRVVQGTMSVPVGYAA